MIEHLNLSALFSQNYQRFLSNIMHFVTPWYILKIGWKPTSPPKRNLLLNISAIRWPNGSVASRKNVATWWLSRRQMRQQITLSFAWLVLRYRGRKRREALQPLFQTYSQLSINRDTSCIIGCKIPIIFYGNTADVYGSPIQKRLMSTTNIQNQAIGKSQTERKENLFNL